MPIAMVIELIGGDKTLFADAEFRKDLQRINQNAAKRMRARFAKTTATWEHQVTFTQKTVSRPDASASVMTTDPIYRYVNNGTSVRYATMTRDFQAKTRPGSLQARPGRGRVAYVDVTKPRPGIQPRYFTEKIAAQVLPPYQKQIAAAISRASLRKGMNT